LLSGMLAGAIYISLFLLS